MSKEGENLVEAVRPLLERIDKLKAENRLLKEFEGDEPAKLLRLCATTMDDWSSWDNSIVRARANWLRRFASHLDALLTGGDAEKQFAQSLSKRTTPLSNEEKRNALTGYVRVDLYEKLEAENEALLDALLHSGYDSEDCIDCGGPPHNEWCRHWKVRHLLPFDMTGEQPTPEDTPISDIPASP